MMEDHKVKRTILSRDEGYVKHTSTRICREIPTEHNPYLPKEIQYSGYDLFELMQKRSLVDVIFLLLKGELPNKEQARLFEALFIALIDPGPRHPATRAAMNTGVGKTDPAHILPIGLSVCGGSFLGGEEVTDCMHFLRRNHRQNAADIATNLLTSCKSKPNEGDWHIAPGFGTRFGDVDIIASETAKLLLNISNDNHYLSWANAFAQSLNEQKLGWLMTGIAAASFLDLGFHPRAGSGLFQLASAPGLLAHGLELANKPRTDMPFLDDEKYIIER